MPRSYLVPTPIGRPFYNSETGLRTTNRFGVEIDSSFVTNINLAGRITAQSRSLPALSVTIIGAVYGDITAQSRCTAVPSISVPLHGRIEATSRASTFIPVPVSLAGRSFSKSNMRIVPPGIKTLAGTITAKSRAAADFVNAPAARTKDFGVTIING